MKCLWCAAETTLDKNKQTAELKYADLEHIFPESVGGISCLEKGKVCSDCNTKFAKVDRHLRDKNLMMAKKYQDQMQLTGKPLGKIRGKTDKDRKRVEKIKVLAFNGGTTIHRDWPLNAVSITGSPGGMSGWEPHNEQFSRALHKCATNVLYNDFSFEQMRPRFDDLIEFVNTDHAYNRPWPYGVCYSNIFMTESFPPSGFVVDNRNGPVAVVLIFPALVAAVGIFPDALTSAGLQSIGGHILKQTFDEMGIGEFAEKYYTGNMFNTTDNPGEETLGLLYKFCLLRAAK
jgi:hypothetical protein